MDHIDLRRSGICLSSDEPDRQANQDPLFLMGKGPLHPALSRMQNIEFRGVGTLGNENRKRLPQWGAFFYFSLVKAGMVDNVPGLIYEK